MIEIMTNPAVSNIVSNPNSAKSFAESGLGFDQKGVSKIRQDEELIKVPNTEKTLNDLRRFLSSALFQQIGPITARKVVANFGVNTIKIIEETPHRLNEVEGIGKCRIASIINGWTAQSRLKDDCNQLRLLN